jgi:hypothetical protein
MMLRIAIILLLRSSPAWAGASVSYSLAPAAIDAGGGLSTSPSYSADISHSVGVAAASANYTLSGGFAGQAEGGTSIVIYLSPAELAESGTGQLTAELVAADGSTRNPLAAESVVWTIVSGPLASISATGLVTAAVTYQPTRATVRATSGAYTSAGYFTVDNTIPDNYGSYAGDSLPDDWQVRHLGLNHPAPGPAHDADADGFDNLFEYNAGLDPVDPRSTLAMGISGTIDGKPLFSITPWVSGVTYTLLGSSDLMSWSTVTGPVFDQGRVRHFVDPAGANARRFYFLDVRRN